MMRLVIYLLCFKGVDLNLDQFDLSAPERFASNTPSCSASLDSLEVTMTLRIMQMPSSSNFHFLQR